jgi:hypothetical protein
VASLAICLVAMLWFFTTRGLFSRNDISDIPIATDVREVLT